MPSKDRGRPEGLPVKTGHARPDISPDPRADNFRILPKRHPAKFRSASREKPSHLNRAADQGKTTYSPNKIIRIRTTDSPRRPNSHLKVFPVRRRPIRGT